MPVDGRDFNFIQLAVLDEPEIASDVIWSSGSHQILEYATKIAALSS